MSERAEPWGGAPTKAAKRITEDELRRYELDADQSMVIAARLGRKLARTDEFAADIAAEVLKPFVEARIRSHVELVAEIRRYRALLLEIEASLPAEAVTVPGFIAEVDVIRAERP